MEGYLNIGSSRSTNFMPKETARISCSRNLWYLWLTKDVDWDYATPWLKADFSNVTLKKADEDDVSAVRIRPPHGNKHYPGLHIHPKGFSIKPFKLIEVSSYIVKRNEIVIGIPKSIRGNFTGNKS